MRGVGPSSGATRAQHEIGGCLAERGRVELSPIARERDGYRDELASVVVDVTRQRRRRHASERGIDGGDECSHR